MQAINSAIDPVYIFLSKVIHSSKYFYTHAVPDARAPKAAAPKLDSYHVPRVERLSVTIQSLHELSIDSLDNIMVVGCVTIDSSVHLSQSVGSLLSYHAKFTVAMEEIRSVAEHANLLNHTPTHSSQNPMPFMSHGPQAYLTFGNLFLYFNAYRAKTKQVK